MAWSSRFDDPIKLPDGRKLITLKDAATYVIALPKAEHDAPQWQAAMEALLLVAENGGPTMLARIGVMRALNRNRETGLALEPYPLAAHACLAMVGLKYEDLPVTAVFDRIEKVESKLATARSYLAGDKFIYPGLCDHIATTWPSGPLTSRTVPALQAADLIAWEVRKAHFKMKPWQLSRSGPHTNRWAQWHDYVKFTRETTGEDPGIRKSLDALISGPVKSIFWDYLQLMTTHKVRHGIWTAAQAAE